MRSGGRIRGVLYRARLLAFTLIELLLVVAVIALLAAIAVPNFLEAQVRAKSARAKADLRAIATALESYAAQNNHYPPNDGDFNLVAPELTTPVAFLTNNMLVDPFSDKEHDALHRDRVRFYTYGQVVTQAEFLRLIERHDPHVPAVELVDSPNFNPQALKKYGCWRLVSNGPDRRYADPHFVFGSDPLDPNGVLMGADVPYDPTNGTVSKGNILYTQKGAIRP